LLDAVSANAALVNRSGDVKFVNESWRRFASANQMRDPSFGVGSNYFAVCSAAQSSGEASEVAEALRQILDGSLQQFALEYPCHSATQDRWFRVVLGAIQLDGAPAAAVIHLETTAQKLAEIKLARTNRLYAVLTHVNDMVTRADDMHSVYSEACRVLVDEGKLRMALVALVQANGDFEVVTHAGHVADYLVDLRVTSRPERHGFGTMGTAARGGRVDVCNDFLNESRMEPWQTAAARAGYGATASFPLRSETHTRGVLTVFAEDVGYFQEDEVRLLEGIANSLSYAAESLRQGSEKQRAEAELRASEANMARAQSIAHFGSWELDLCNLEDVNANPLRWSDEMYRIAGFEPGKVAVSNDLFFSLVHPEDRERIEAAVAVALRDNTMYDITHRLLRPNGEQRWVHERGQIFFEAGSGRPVKLVGTMHDITEKKQAEEAAAASELRLQLILASVADGIHVLDRDGNIEFENSAATTMFGASVAAMKGRHAHDLVHHHRPDGREYPLEECPIYQTLQDGRVREVHDELFFRADGSSFPVDYTCCPMLSPDGVVTGTVVSFRDISERKASEHRYQVAARELAKILDSSMDVICSIDGQGRFVRVNAASATVWGYSPEELLGSHYIDKVAPADREVTTREAASIMSGRAATGFENRYVRKDGRIVHIQWTATWSEEDQVMFCVARDVTLVRESERRIAEQASLLDRAQDAIIVRDLEHRVQYWNASAERVYGWAAPEVLGRSVQELLYRDLKAFREAGEALFRTGEWIGELEQLTRDGRAIVVEGRWTLLRDEEGQPKSVLAINTDITQRKLLEQQFLRAQRMESIGTLAGGIAHDLNNVLAPMMVAVDLLMLDEQDDERLELLHTIHANTRRGAEMVGQVLSFARGVQGRQTDLQVAHVLNELMKIVTDTFPKSITVTLELDPDLSVVRADPTQIHQVLLNLCVNARDAMPSGGQLTITAHNFRVDPLDATFKADAEQTDYVRLEVRDTGTGIAPEILEQIFDPFFTSKELGKGTGLGLFTTAAIVKGHGGFLRVSTELGQGSTFSVYLPAAVGARTAEAATATRHLPRGNGEMVLVVDDEAAIRHTTGATLQAFGYRVLLAADGTEAVRLFTEHEQEIALVLTDIMMPNLDGAATARVLTQINPAVRIVATSGVPASLDADPDVKAAVRQFLPKPYSAEGLLQALEAVLR
jgi:PAS domain S-box-containing protein